MSLTLSPDANARTRTPSYLGSNAQLVPDGISVPIDAIIGTIFDGEMRGAALGLLATGRLDFQVRFACDAISSIALPVVIEVSSVSMSHSGSADASRCLISSHCGLSSPR